MTISEERITKLTDTLAELAEVSGTYAETRIVPNLEVIDAAPADLSSDYIIVENEEGYYAPVVKTPGLTVATGDFVNVLYIKGTEPIAIQQGSESSSAGFPLTTKGDLLTYSTLLTRLGVGANDTVLTADNTQPTGLKWAAAAAGGNVWPLPGEANIGATAYAAIDDFFDALTSGDQGIIGEGAFTTDYTGGNATIPDGSDVKGSGVDVTILTSADTGGTLGVDGEVLLEQLTVENTDTSNSKAILVAAGSTIRFDTVKTVAESGSGYNEGFYIFQSEGVLINCEAYAAGGGTNDYAVWVYNNSTAKTVTIRGGYFDGDVVSDQSGATIHLDGPTITGSVTAQNSGTITGWYKNADGDILAAPSSLPDLADTTNKWGNIYLATAKDLYAKNRNAGVQQRLESWLNPTGYISDVSWTWANDAPFDGAPSTVDTSTFPDLTYIINDSITEDHFYYTSVSPSADTLMRCRVGMGVYSYGGVRLDAGDNDDFFEIRLVDSATVSGMKMITARYQVGGGGVGTADVVDPMPPAMIYMQVYHLISATAALAYTSFNSPILIYTGAADVGASWTPSRAGIIFGQRNFVSSTDRAGIFGEYKLTVT